MAYANKMSVLNLNIGPTKPLCKADYSDPRVIKAPSPLQRRTIFMVAIDNVNIKIVELQQLMQQGLKIILLQTTLSDEDKLILIKKMKEAENIIRTKTNSFAFLAAASLELKGNAAATGILADQNDSILIKHKSEITITNCLKQFNNCTEKLIFVDYLDLAKDISVGTMAAIGGNKIILKCKKIINEETIICTVEKEGYLQNIQPFRARGKTCRSSLPEKDFADLKFAFDNEVDILIVNDKSLNETAPEARNFYEQHNARPPFIMATIGEMKSVHNIDSIFQIADGILFARNFLLFDIGLEKMEDLHKIQKWVTAKCLRAGKPLYLTGGLFSSSLNIGVSTNSEFSDIGNAVIDGVFGLLINDYTNVNYLIESIKRINLVCGTAEICCNAKADIYRILNEFQVPTNAAEACVIGCAVMANRTNSHIIIVPTVTGETLRLLMKVKVIPPIIAVTSKERIARRLRVYRGVVPIVCDPSTDGQSFLEVMAYRVDLATHYSSRRHWTQFGDSYVVFHKSSPYSSYCDAVRLFTITKKAFSIECPE